MYTIEEFLTDVTKHEGLAHKPVLPPHPEEYKLLRLYSDVFQNPLASSNTVDALKSRIDLVLSEFLVPDIDVEPDETFELSIYEKVACDTHEKYKLIVHTNDREKCEEILNKESSYANILVVFNARDKIKGLPSIRLFSRSFN